MDAEISGRQPNQALRHERELRGWSQRKVADEIGATSKLVSRWESGINLPDPYYRQRLCELFEKNAKELGFILPPEAPFTPVEEPATTAPGELPHFFRACIDPHVGNFLRWLAASPLHSKVVLTSRLIPRELDNLANCRCIELSALSTRDAQTFLQIQGVQGSRGEMQVACTFYGNHPLALRLLAGLIAHDPMRPGDITVAADYSPLAELVQREHHILSLAYDALAPATQQLLSQIAAFRSRIHFEMLKVTTQFTAQKELKASLVELVERGLLFFDRERGFYDLHPVVRQYAYARLLRKEAYHQRLMEYFQAQSGLGPQDLPAIKKLRALLTAQDDRTDVAILEGLMPIIELYYHKVLKP